MKYQDFNHDWTVRHLDEEGPGMPVILPDDAMLREKRTGEAQGGLNVSWFEGRQKKSWRSTTFWNLKAYIGRRKCGSTEKRLHSALTDIQTSIQTATHFFMRVRIRLK